MKIGILTYHQAENFGAIVQAYALLTYLNSQGHDAEIIDYRCRAIEVHYHIFNPAILLSRKNVRLSLMEYLNRFKNITDRKVRKRKFADFIQKYIPISPALYHIKSPLNYDTVIVGSDQVWNFYLNKGSENVYLLDFPFNEHTQKLSYAASSERNGLNRIQPETLKRCLNSFERISVRESFLKTELANYTDKPINVCLDPTFLLRKEDYMKLVHKPLDEKYILVYHMTPMPEYIPAIEKIAEENHCGIIELYGGYHTGDKKRIVSDWGPIDVLGLICHAQMVFTTSSHGLALSLILKKNVWVINKGDNFRQQNLLSIAGLSHRLLKGMDNYSQQDIDYDKVTTKLQPVIELSKLFLKL